MPDEYVAKSIRDYFMLGQFIGKRVVDVTESDPDEARFVMLMFDDGSALKFPVSPQGFDLLNVEVPDA